MRQAVVLIHGIGEQKPMDTVREFADSLLPDPTEGGKPKYWSKPDQISELFELRRLTTPATRTAPNTDFYEFYWACHVGGTTVSHLVTWLWQLLTRPSSVPPRLKPIWWLVVTLLTVAAALAAAGALPWLRSDVAKVSFATSAGLFLLTGILNLVFIRYIGDAARYLNPSPENIEIRRKIRSEGVQLLRKLHEHEKYDRIIIVGHSLGSVIGYDILRHFWTQVNAFHRHPLSVKQDALKALEETGEALRKGATFANVEAFRRAQEALWKEQRQEIGSPWRITDFITLGSPLSHASLLLARSSEELNKRIQERELPSCPPQSEDGRYSYIQDPYEVKQGEILLKRSVRVLNHAALFACTRWTNLYFSGDFVGGPLASAFGLGIRDEQVRLDSALAGCLPFSHTKYWQRTGEGSGKKFLSIEVLREAMGLDSKGWLARGAPTPAVSEPKAESAVKETGSLHD